MQAVSCRRACFAPARTLRFTPRPCRHQARASGGGGFDIDKIVEDLPVPVEYAYAGVAWGVLLSPLLAVLFQAQHHSTIGTALLLFATPFNFISKSIFLLHLLAAATSVARLGAIARPDQQTGESEAAKAFGWGLLTGPFNVNWLGTERFKKLKQ